MQILMMNVMSWQLVSAGSEVDDADFDDECNVMAVSFCWLIVPSSKVDIFSWIWKI